MKKKFVSILSALLCVGMLAACGFVLYFATTLGA